MIQDFESSGIDGYSHPGRLEKPRGVGLVLKKVELLANWGLDLEILPGEVAASLEGAL